MNLASIISISLMTLLISCLPNIKKTDLHKFTGRWSLAIVEEQLDSSSNWLPRQDHYKNRKGFIIYDGKGGMGVHHVTENYEQYVIEGKGGPDNLTGKDLRHLADNYVYFGKYRVNTSTGIIDHYIESANFPALWGTTAKRKYQFSGDTLILTQVSNRYPISRLKWVRLNDLK